MRRASFYVSGHIRAHAIQRALDITAAIALGLLVAWLAAQGF